MSNETKQTAVEWLEDQIFKSAKFIDIDLFQAIEQAKEMEKEQIVNSCYSWYSKLGNTNNVIVYKLPEEYYNETYGGDK